MTEHCIRLRGGWECCPVDSSVSDTYRLTLPTRWGSDRPRRLRLTRRFNRPPLDADCWIGLRLEQVAGIQALLLNGQPLACASPDESRYEIPLSSLPDRNLLVLEIEPPQSTDSGGAVSPEWGAIALVIRTPGTANLH